MLDEFGPATQSPSSNVLGGFPGLDLWRQMRLKAQGWGYLEEYGTWYAKLQLPELGLEVNTGMAILFITLVTKSHQP